MAENTNSRWWEFYFVRYFVGTVLGSIIVYVLAVSSGSALSANLVPGISKEISYPHILLLGAYGLAYCYIASGPVLVLHAARAIFSPKVQSNFKLWLAGAILIGLLSILTIALGADLNTYHILAAALAYLVLIIQVVPLVFVFLNDSRTLTDYYLTLSSKRSDSEKNPSRKEYIESYRHLREHGNAFLIVLFEIVLAICLWNLPSESLRVFAPIIAFIWILPGSIVWFVGSVLESNMVSTSE